MPCVRIIPALAALLLAGCGSEPTAAPSSGQVVSTPGITSSVGATHEHAEFSFYASNDVFLSCLNELTHWEGPVSGTTETTTTPSGSVVIRLKAKVDPSFFVERANGVRYYPTGPAQMTRWTELIGPVYHLSLTEPAIFESLDGDRLVTSYHLQVVIDPNGEVVVEQATGACP